MGDVPKDAKSIFLQAVEQVAPDQWPDFLKQACGSDSELRRQVQRLLDAHASGDRFMAKPAAPMVHAACLEMAPITEQPGTMIGPYKLVEQIGTGGMGLVFLAQQQTPVKRDVALKVIKPGMDSKQVIARFEAERQALALMDHPNIARVLDAGSTDSGRPYFVMDLVRGIPIADYCDGQRLSTRQRLDLFVSVCQAVQHAHQKGVIHRDIKPSNVLVTLHDATPVPKVIDFGVAKATGQQLTEESVVTGYAQLLGTPLYMSPEQAGLSGLDIDTRTDIYSLGVLLYELLTGATPFDREKISQVSFDEVCRIIREEEPPKPSTRINTLGDAEKSIAQQRHTDSRTLARQLSGELEWIVMKALEKDRARRYETVADFARDVQRYLHGDAVAACPPSTWYRFRKFARRNRTALIAGSAVALAVLVGAVVATGQAIRATKAERLALKHKQLAEEAAEEQRRLRDEADRHRRQAEAMLLSARQDFCPTDAAFGPDGNFYVTSSYTDRVLRFAGDSGKFIDEFVTAGSGGLDRPDELVFGPDADGDGNADLYVATSSNHAVLRYSGATGEFLDTFVSPGSGGMNKPTGLVFGPDGHLYVSSFGTHNVLRYHGCSGEFLGDFVTRHSGGLSRPYGAIFGRDGNLYVASYLNHSILRFDGASGEFLDEFVSTRSGGLNLPKALQFGPDGELYVISRLGSWEGVLRYDGRDGTFVDEFVSRGAGGLSFSRSLVFGPRGNLYVPGFHADSVIQFDGRTGEFLGRFTDYDRRQLISVQPNNPVVQASIIHAYLDVGRRHINSGNVDKAHEAFQNAIDKQIRIVEHYPDRLELRTDLARLYTKCGLACQPTDSEWALAHYVSAIECDPKDVEAYLSRARCYLSRLELNLAIADCEQVLRLCRSLPDQSSLTAPSKRQLASYCHEAGDCLYAVGEKAKAADAFRKSFAYAATLVELDPLCVTRHRFVAVRLGTCPIPELRDADRALKHARAAWELEPDTAKTLKSLGLAYYRHGDWQAAAETLEQWWRQETYSENTHYGFVLAMAYWQLGQKDKARRTYDEYVDRTEGVQLGGPIASLRFREEASELLQLHDTAPKGGQPTPREEGPE